MLLTSHREGVTFHKNRRNRAVVIRIHYTADPAKRSAEWREEAARYMKPEAFQKEYEMDATACDRSAK